MEEKIKKIIQELREERRELLYTQRKERDLMDLRHKMNLDHNDDKIEILEIIIQQD